MQSNVKVFDNRAVNCFNPEYTFVKSCKLYAKNTGSIRTATVLNTYDQPKQFLRHYYDLYKLLTLKRVRDFIETAGYANYK